VPEKTEEVHKNVKTAGFQLREEPGTCRMESSSVVYLTTTFDKM
jgi:hypothetical protein